MQEIATEFVSAFTRLYEPRPYLERVFAYCQSLGLPRWLEDPACQRRWWTQLLRLGEAKGTLVLLWRQGVRRESRGLFWRQLLRMALERPQLLADYISLLMLNEHFLDYREVVRTEVEAQLRWSDSQPPARSAPAIQAEARGR